ncbi:amino acid--tRNA ligase-related protein [Dokdonella sp.]|uniref:amino acid--tRNA ligase-related protein n=1 Tax=Dokdonella sp. TaxID=2291710 RepID=UPI0031B8A43A
MKNTAAGIGFSRDASAVQRPRATASPQSKSITAEAVSYGCFLCRCLSRFGRALGIERLLMCLAGSDDIRDVLAFAFDEA